jgi:hypothetical protein
MQLGPNVLTVVGTDCVKNTLSGLAATLSPRSTRVRGN